MDRRNKITTQKQRERRKRQLRRQLHHAREDMMLGQFILAENCNIKKRAEIAAENLLVKHRTKVILGASVVGGYVLASYIQSNKATPEEKKTLFGWMRGWAYSMAVKKAKSYAVDKTKDWLIENIQQEKSDEGV